MRARASGRRVLALALAASTLFGCSAANVPAPSIGVPTFDTAALERLLRDAIAEVDRLAASPPPLALPPDLANLLEQTGIELPPVPSNAAEICAVLGTPGLAGVTGAGLGAVLETLAAGGEVGLVAGLVTTVVFSTCPAWSPHLESALRDLL